MNLAAVVFDILAHFNDRLNLLNTHNRRKQWVIDHLLDMVIIFAEMTQVDVARDLYVRHQPSQNGNCQFFFKIQSGG